MTIDSIIIDREQTIATHLKKCIQEKFPEISIRGEASNSSEASRMIQAVNPMLIFLNASAFHNDPCHALREKKNRCFELIYISEHPEDAATAVRQNACGFLLKPFNLADVVFSVGSAIKKIAARLQSENGSLPEGPGSL